jgi:mannose-1-phosphate guanylyltransferase
VDFIVIMAGGGGTRLWPLSRRSRPKQFLSLLPGGETLLGATVRRATRVVPIERTLVVTAASQVDEVRRCVPSLPAENIVVEPEARNTAACIGLACVEVRRRDAGAVIGVLPSDQFVGDDDAFARAVELALRSAADGPITTIGIRPTAPETGFGYIQAAGSGAVRGVQRFVEKPDAATAAGYLASGDYLWNAGMFFFRASVMIDAMHAHLAPLGEILDAIAADSTAVSRYAAAPRISIDYGVIEKVPPSSLRMVPGDFAWNDVGSWAALPEVRPHDEAGNTVLGDALAVDARDNVLVGDGRLVTAVGVSGLVIVATGNSVLVLPRERAQDVRKIVDALEKSGRTGDL